MRYSNIHSSHSTSHNVGAMSDPIIYSSLFIPAFPTWLVSPPVRADFLLLRRLHPFCFFSFSFFLIHTYHMGLHLLQTSEKMVQVEVNKGLGVGTCPRHRRVRQLTTECPLLRKLAWSATSKSLIVMKLYS